MQNFEQVVSDMLSHVAKSGRYMENRFRQIEANDFTLPEDPIMANQNWNSEANTAYSVYWNLRKERHALVESSCNERSYEREY